MLDVLVVGAGPAGAVAAAVLARAGARVGLVDRASFPRDKLCGDTVNPGALALLDRLGLASAAYARGLPVDGMRLTGEGGVVIDGRYPRGLTGRALPRRDLDWALVQAAIAAGASFESSVVVRRAVLSGAAGGPAVGGAIAAGRGAECALPARVTIAADGRRSTIAFGLGLARHPRRPRRWAIGGYYDGATSQRRLRDVSGTSRSALGEMHVRRNGYIGIAPVPDDLTNVCLVRPFAPGDLAIADPATLLRRALDADPLLRDRFAAARLVAPPTVLGPLAVDVAPARIDGLFLAGDAAGFIDPMTGDGLRFAIRGGELAAHAALDALEHGWRGVHARLDGQRAREFAAKWRFNRTLRALVASPRAVTAAAAGARIAPSLLRAAIEYAGDCRLAGTLDPA